MCHLNRFARCTLSIRKLTPAVWHHFKCHFSFWYLQPRTAATCSASNEGPNRPHSTCTPLVAKLELGANSRKSLRNQRRSVVSFFVDKMKQLVWILELRVLATPVPPWSSLPASSSSSYSVHRVAPSILNDSRETQFSTSCSSVQVRTFIVREQSMFFIVFAWCTSCRPIVINA